MGCKPKREAPVELHPGVISYGLMGGYLGIAQVRGAKNYQAKGFGF